MRNDTHIEWLVSTVIRFLPPLNEAYTYIYIYTLGSVIDFSSLTSIVFRIVAIIGNEPEDEYQRW